MNMTDENDEYEGSEFGKGLTYCLALFLCHSERDYMTPDNVYTHQFLHEAWMWFNGAGDHLFEMVIPDTLPDDLRARINEFQGKVMRWRLHDATMEDKTWAINEAKSLLLEIDKWLGVDGMKGDFE